MKRALFVLAALLGSACTGCTPHPIDSASANHANGSSTKVAPPVAVAAAFIEAPAPVPSELATPSSGAAIEWEKWWQGFGIPKCAYLAPTKDFVGDDGGVDVIFHFHAGQMSERDMKQSGVRGVFVSCGYGLGTGGYSGAFEDPDRFGVMMKRLMWTLSNAKSNPTKRKVHLRRLALVSWSAGFASVNRILAVPQWYEATDAVVLLDSLHAQYMDDPTDPARPHTASEGVDHVDTRGLRRFARFATDAIAGKKTMVITHTSIVPPSYASTSEATAALLGLVDVTPQNGELRDDVRLPNMAALSVKVDQGGLHVRGFRGMGPQDHFDHLHLIGEALRSWVVPRWYTPARERP